MFDSLSHSIWGGLIVITLSLPVAGSLAALLALDAISAYGVRWKLADDWHHLFHESTQGALLIAVLGLPWLIIVVSFGAGGLLALYGGGGSFLFPLNVLSKIPIVGQHLAAFLALFMVLVFLGLSMYVAYTSVRAIVRLIRTPRTGYVQGGVPRRWRRVWGMGEQPWMREHDIVLQH
jgi:hypothetical protein